MVLIEPGERLGGLTTGGLGQTDVGNQPAIGGVSREFFDRVPPLQRSFGREIAAIGGISRQRTNQNFRIATHVGTSLWTPYSSWAWNSYSALG